MFVKTRTRKLSTETSSFSRSSVFKMFSVQTKTISWRFLNSSGLKSVFGKLSFCDGLLCTVGLTEEIKLRFRDGLLCTVGLTEEIKLRFRDGLLCTVGLTEEIKLRFRDGLLCTVGLTEEIKLRFRDGLLCTVGLTVEIKLRFHIPPAFYGQDLKVTYMRE